MDLSANHLGFVIASYALTFVFLAVLTLTILIRDRKLRAEAERLDAQRKRTRA